MHQSPNQYTVPMGAINSDAWREIDAQLVEAEAELAREKRWHETDAQDALDEFEVYLGSMSIEEAEMALAGLREYEAAVQHEAFARYGWVALTEDL